MSLRDGKLLCDGWCNSAGAVTHLDHKGFIYCAPCGAIRKGSQCCRKLTPGELTKLQRGEVLAQY